MKKYAQVKDLGTVAHFLGNEVLYDEVRGMLKILQQPYIEQVGGGL